MRFARADILAGNNGAAGRERGKDVDEQHVEHIDERDARHRRLTDIRDLHGVDHTHEHGERLLNDERHNELLQIDIGKRKIIGYAFLHGNTSYTKLYYIL